MEQRVNEKMEQEHTQNERMEEWNRRLMEEWNRRLMEKAEQLQDKLGNGWIIFEEDNRFVVRRDRTYFIISPIGVDYVTQSIGRTEFESILGMLSRISE